jgi:HrpA-like RNA helicase
MSSGEFKKRVRSYDWEDESDDDNVKHGISKDTEKKIKTARLENDNERKDNENGDINEEDMLFGNPVSLKNNNISDKSIDYREHEILKLEVEMYEKDIKRNGISILNKDEKNDYEKKKNILNNLLKKQSNNYLVPEDYVTEDGKIDLKRKAKILKASLINENKKSEQEWYELQLNQAEKVNQLSKLKKDIQIEEKEYEYVFDKSNMVNYVADIPEDQMKEIENKIELEELIEIEEKRVKSIEDTKRSLPVYEYKDELLDAINKHQVLIIVGETGSGKTTQLPQYLYEAGFNKGGKIIGCTQPRRVAAVSVATRVADEVGTKLGNKVGYSIRFDEKSSKNTVIKYMTDGMLVREFLIDSEINNYSAMIIDEAHERTLHTDILLGLLKDLIKKRPNFKIIISSATINAKKFSDYFNKAPIFNVPGRRYPVEIFYTEQPEGNYLSAAITTVFQIHMSQKNRGDILVFLTGQDEIETMAESLKDTCKKLSGQIKDMIICPIYSNLPPEQQKKIFEPTPKEARKVVISTNIAETSLTIDGIVYVIDCGFTKEKVYNSVTGMESLEVNPCSRASADQRAGRAGRVGPGKCFRLYTKWAYLNELPTNPTPEILRTDLTTVVLLMLTLGINDLIHFDFMDRPSTKSLAKALELLYSLGALNERGQLTNIGIRLAVFPTKPMLAKALLTASELNCTKDVLSVVAMLEEMSTILINSKEHRDQAKNAHARFVKDVPSPLVGDHLLMLSIWNEFESNGYSSQWCHDNFVQYKALVRVRNVRKQLERICNRLRLNMGEYRDKGETTLSTTTSKELMLLKVVKAITAGYFVHCACLSRTGEGYLTIPGGLPVKIHPGSALNIDGEQTPAGIVIFHEVVLTSQAFLRGVQPVRSQWVAQYGAHCINEKELNKLKEMEIVGRNSAKQVH